MRESHPLPKDPADYTFEHVAFLLEGDGRRALEALVRDALQFTAQTEHKPLEATYGAKSA